MKGYKIVVKVLNAKQMKVSVLDARGVTKGFRLMPFGDTANRDLAIMYFMARFGLTSSNVEFTLY